MTTETILVTGANGSVGAALVLMLRKQYGVARVIAADLHPVQPDPDADPYYERLEAVENVQLARVIQHRNITQLYHLGGLFQRESPSDPTGSWHYQMKSLLTVLEVAKECGVSKVFWPAPPGDPMTAGGIVRIAGERWCHYYRVKLGFDVRTLRYELSSSTDVLHDTIALMHSTLQTPAHAALS